MIEDHFGVYLILIPHCMTEILAKESKSGKSTVLALGTVIIIPDPLSLLEVGSGHETNPSTVTLPAHACQGLIKWR